MLNPKEDDKDPCSISSSRRSVTKISEPILRGVGRQSLKLVFHVGDKVTYMMDTVKLDTKYNLLVSTRDWVEGIVVGQTKVLSSSLITYVISSDENACFANIARNFDIKNGEVDLTLFEGQFAQRTTQQMWPVVTYRECPQNSFYSTDEVAVCTVTKFTQEETWSYHW